MLIKKSIDKKILSKIKNYYIENKWNIFDTIVFIQFYVCLFVRFSPVTGNVFTFWGESCYEIARVLYGVNLILWYIRILQMVSCVAFWGPKIIIMQALVQKLVVYVALILIFLLPFAAVVETVINKTQEISLAAVSNAINRAFWFGFNL